MNTRFVLYALVLLTFLSGCGGQKNTTNDLQTKKELLENLKKEISKLETEISSLDTSSSLADKNLNSKKVLTTVLRPQAFQHFIDLQGIVVNQSDIVVLPLGGAGQIKEIYVEEGSVVKKGTVILRLDDTMIRNQMNILQSQLDFAKKVYAKQEKLWQEKIGTEIEYLRAQSSVETLETQLTNLKTSYSYTKVVAPIDGVIDELNVKVGEIFTGVTGKGESQIRIVDNKGLKLKIEVPENYLSKVRIGTPVQVQFLETDYMTQQRVSMVSKHINPNSRSFVVELKMPSTNRINANQIALAKILDYEVHNAIVIPINAVQVDEKGKFVFVIDKKNNKNIVLKKYITIKEIYNDFAQISIGLETGDVVITDGFQSIVEGQELTNVE